MELRDRERDLIATSDTMKRMIGTAEGRVAAYALPLRTRPGNISLQQPFWVALKEIAVRARLLVCAPARSISDQPFGYSFASTSQAAEGKEV